MKADIMYSKEKNLTYVEFPTKFVWIPKESC